MPDATRQGRFLRVLSVNLNLTLLPSGLACITRLTPAPGKPRVCMARWTGMRLVAPGNTGLTEAEFCALDRAIKQKGR